MAQGWVSIHRQLNDNWLWKDKPFSKGQAWIDILLRVNHKPAKVPIGNQVINVQPGQTIWSVKDMADKWGWSRKKVDNFLNILQTESQISKNSTTKYTLITVENWELYQTEEQQKNINGTSNEHQKNTNNNDNNEFNENAIKKNSKFYPPTLLEVQNYIDEKNYNINAERFVNYYGSIGWMVGKNKMKDWKKAVANWNTRQGNNNNDDPYAKLKRG